jgi:hypothetical protein
MTVATNRGGLNPNRTTALRQFRGQSIAPNYMQNENRIAVIYEQDLRMLCAGNDAAFGARRIDLFCSLVNTMTHYGHEKVTGSA